MGIPALPFSQWDKTIPKPLGDKYINNPKTIGQKLRNKRLELHLLQKDVALIFETSEDTITNWENDRYEPQGRFVSRIEKFLLQKR